MSAVQDAPLMGMFDVQRRLSAFRVLSRWARLFAQDRRGNVAVIAALTMFPLTTLMGFATDYSRAGNSRAALQAALDGAVLAGAIDGSTNWKKVAAAQFAAGYSARNPAATLDFQRNDQAGTYTGTATAEQPAQFAGFIGVNTITISALSVSKNSVAGSDNSCIYGLDTGAAVSDNAITFNGAPNVALTGCTIRSNTSVRCNGHSTGAAATIAVGVVNGACSNPVQAATPIPDIYEPLAVNIKPSCTSYPGATWIAGVAPPFPGVTHQVRGSYTEYHVCGPLTLAGSGPLFAASGDAVIIVENGGVDLDDKANVQLAQTSLVLTGNNKSASRITFPNGNGKAATLTLSPPTDPHTPRHGISVYQDPKLTFQVSEDWGPGAKINLEGVMYLPHADVTIRGVQSTTTPTCSKMVVNTLTSDGGVALTQSASGCARFAVPQWQASKVVIVR
jgi:Flp pilus assembly protein TadG